jgi:hypothetical protein
MEKDTEEVETVLAQHMVRLFKAHHLSGTQAKRLLEKVRLSIDAGEMKCVPRSSERPSLAKRELLRVRTPTEKSDRLQKAGGASQRNGA